MQSAIDRGWNRARKRKFEKFLREVAEDEDEDVFDVESK